ncbi:AsmA-like C-terminal region-containing protein [Aquimarina hainanensis]|uniref:AsmA-like C-terminal region-containing protein n=1 Tax=Aquimarina hainanensis TaxID=1578017 RepID=A0ABW5N6D1_9FLAO
MKKIVKIIGAFLLVCILALIALPFLFKGSIQDKVLHFINEQVNATVHFSDVDISLFQNFPQATVVINDLSVTNHTPFEGDTLAYSKRIELAMGMSQLFKTSSQAVNVTRVIIDEASITIKTDSLGNSNLDIAKTTEKEQTTPETSSSDFTFDLKHYELNNSNIRYQDDVSKIKMDLTTINHVGEGSVSGQKIILDTQSSVAASLDMDGSNYLDKNKLQLDAELELDLENQKYSFRENKLLLNQLPLEFAGFVQLLEKSTLLDLSFKTPTSDFKNLLAVIPASYAKDLNGVKTSGDFSVDGMVKGHISDTQIPTMDIKILSHNASFKYPDLPKSVTGINIDTKVKNDTGNPDDTYITIDNFTFKIDQDAFAAKGSLRNITKNMLVSMGLHGTVNLANVNQAYPLELEQKLNGIANANVQVNFDMNALEKEQYQHIKSSGSAGIKDFAYTSEELPNEIHIQQANVLFQPETITLENLQATTGASDMEAKGSIHNLMGFLFAKQDLKGNFDVSSTVFDVHDFMVEDTAADSLQQTTSTTEEALQIPSFLDATLTFDAKKVIYDNLTLKDAKGTVKIKDETAYLQKVTSSIFDGGIAFDGKVSTKEKKPNFDMALQLNKINIAQSFSSLDLLKGYAPIAKALTGLLTTELQLNGDLNDDLTPVLTSIKGSALAEILNAQVNSSKAPLISKLDGKLDFLKLDKLNIKNIKTHLDFNDGKVNVKPFNFDIKGVKFTAGGSHGLDKNMDYKVTMDVPAKYLGKDVTSLLSQLSPQEAKNMTIGVPIGIAGNFTNPQIKLNTSGAVKEVTQRIIDKQKGKVKDQLLNTGTGVITDLLGGAKSKSDSTKTNTTNTPEKQLKNAAKDILGGMFGRKKKKDTTKTKN